MAILDFSHVLEPLRRCYKLHTVGIKTTCIYHLQCENVFCSRRRVRSEDSNPLGLKRRGTELPPAHLTSDGGELRSPESKSQLFEKVLLDSSLAWLHSS